MTTLDRIVQSVIRCRQIDIHEQRLADEGRPLAHQFSAAGHELAQAMIAVHATDAFDGVFSYYRSKCAWLCSGLSVNAYVASARQKTGSYAGGRNFSVLPYLRQRSGPTIAPVFGGVGSQFEPAIGWAKAIKLDHCNTGKSSPLAFVFAGDGAVSTVGFWSAIREAAAFHLPMVIAIENNGIALGTPATQQMAGGKIAPSLKSFAGLSVHSFDGTDPQNISEVQVIVEAARDSSSPVLIELIVPRLASHSGSSQKTKDQATIGSNSKRDPVARLRSYVLGTGVLNDEEYQIHERLAEQEVSASFQCEPTCYENASTGQQTEYIERLSCPFDFSHPFGANKVSLAHAVNAWLSSILASDDRVILLGEDIGKLGGVHGVTRGLQTRFGRKRVIDASLNESSILGQAMGLSMAGWRPIVEIQYRKYLEPAMEQFHNIGWCDWLTHGEFKLPIIIRVPYGMGQQCDPWHSESNEAVVLRALGYNVACPSSANDAIEVFTKAYQSCRPTIVLEHRGLYYSPLGRERIRSPSKQTNGNCSTRLSSGTDITIVSWGKLCREIARQLSKQADSRCEVIDLQWLRDWDFEAVARSVRKTGRLLIAHEDRRFLGLGAEISAVISEELFGQLKSPVIRIGSKENPVPIREDLVSQTCPTLSDIWLAIGTMLGKSFNVDSVQEEQHQ